MNTLEDVHSRLRSCRLCVDAGYEVFPRAVFSGNASAQIMLIGQAPGITEKEAGRPFNAGSGKRLFQWLADAGIEETWFRKTQYMTAITKCYPGRAKSGSGDRVPSRAEQTLCRPFLDAEMRLVKPKLIIPVGRLAIGLFFDPNLPLEMIIGTQKQHQGRCVVPLPHSSGASRWHQIPDNRERIQRAITLIGEQYKKIIGNLPDS